MQNALIDVAITAFCIQTALVSASRATGDHDVYGCVCGQHIFPLPRHKVTSPGVVRDAIGRLTCLPEGWLQ
ncbi:MAG: hypothetical protein ACRDSI_06585, partial [Pseudonocardiaceae bacterium]